MPAVETLDTIKEIMGDIFYRDDLEVDENTTADEVEEWDSLSHIRLIVAIEKTFGIRFSNSEIESLRNVGDLVRVVEAKTGKS